MYHFIILLSSCHFRMNDHSLYRVVTGIHPEQTRQSYSIKRIIKVNHPLFDMSLGKTYIYCFLSI